MDVGLSNGHAPTDYPPTDPSAAAAATGTGESRKRKYPSDKAYFIAKEILTTERTYKKDLEVMHVVGGVI